MVVLLQPFNSGRAYKKSLSMNYPGHEEVLATRADFDHDLHSRSPGEHAARQRAANERLERVERAIFQLPAVEELVKRERKPTGDDLQRTLNRDDDDDPPKGSTSSRKRKGRKKKKRSLARRSTTDPDGSDTQSWPHLKGSDDEMWPHFGASDDETWPHPDPATMTPSFPQSDGGLQSDQGGAFRTYQT